MKDEPRQLSKEELAKLPVENGKVKVLVLDGKNNKGFELECPEHGDVIAHMHNGKFQKMMAHKEFKIQ